MEAQIEALVGAYLTRGGKVFISPQFHVAWDRELADGGTCPDFVALDFERRHVVVVEVTTASDISSVIDRITKRQRNWYDPVQRRLTLVGAITSEWNPRTLCFLRQIRVGDARKRVSESDVTFHALEDALLEYDYSSERAKGLP